MPPRGPSRGWVPRGEERRVTARGLTLEGVSGSLVWQSQAAQGLTALKSAFPVLPQHYLSWLWSADLSFQV